ncbi:Oidioi.mRNA.OKI2018_I69.XSR.g14508.t1.cds [Oikopleura dioica]|uniref:Oidioi.mRNA.OKI2018_I69.XSR.g14508.t1.cds n=1 Tax=Oikopleura dioica TaxID=34765 RepID=A0ABN7SE23_OIKDI|nr:Oidioi.mRNA.OKI2018_I69.XSR.g14508.t1.cds [Oikopleura dioica]
MPSKMKSHRGVRRSSRLVSKHVNTLGTSRNRLEDTTVQSEDTIRDVSHGNRRRRRDCRRILRWGDQQQEQEDRALIAAQSTGMRLRSGQIKPVYIEQVKREKSSLKRKMKSHVTQTIPYRIQHIQDQHPVSIEVQRANSWSKDDKSINIYITDDGLTLHRRPVSQSTDSIRGAVGYTCGVHLWEVTWLATQRGTHACVGVATKSAPLRAAGYQALVGGNDESWGWDLGRNILLHNDQQRTPVGLISSPNVNNNYHSYPKIDESELTYTVPDSFYMALDMDAGKLGFIADGQWLGWAFEGLSGREIFPTVSCVWGHCEVTLKYINYSRAPLTLKELARRSVRLSLPSTENSVVSKLVVPRSLHRYLQNDGLKQSKNRPPKQCAKRPRLEEDAPSSPVLYRLSPYSETGFSRIDHNAGQFSQ